MSAERPAFVDTNVLVYAFDRSDRRHAPASELLSDLLKSDRFCLSTQVLQELFVTVTRKIAEPLPRHQAFALIEDLSRWNTVQVDLPCIRQAILLMDDASISFWDALIVSAAAAADAELLYTEDFQHGRELQGVRILNPFRD